jgi:hypothetical protein
MLDPQELYALGLAFLQSQVTLLKTWRLWTTGNLLFHLPLLWTEPTNDESYMRCHAILNIFNDPIQELIQT